MNRSELLDSYSDFLKECFKNDWNIDVASWDRATMDNYKNPECPNINEMEYKKCLVGNYIWYLYPHFYKIKKSFKVIQDKAYNNLTKPGNKYILDIGAGWLNGLLAYCDFLKESGKTDANYYINVIANEPDHYKVGILKKHQEEIADIISKNTNDKINIELKFITVPFPDSKDEVKESLNSKQFFDELIIINACIVRWIENFTPDIYEELNSFSDRTHLINIEPTYADNKHDIESKLKSLCDFNSTKIDKLCSIGPIKVDYTLTNHPNGPFSHISSHQNSFHMSYYYATNLQENFFSIDRLKEAYYKTRLNIIQSNFYDRIDLIMFDAALNDELSRLSDNLKSGKREEGSDFKFALTLDYKIHKSKNEDNSYSFRYMSTRKIDNEIVAASIITPISDTDRYIEDIYSIKCSYGNRLAQQSKTRFYEYFLENWIEFKNTALRFAEEKGFYIYQYDIEKYYENVDINCLNDSLNCQYIRPKNDYIKNLTKSLLYLKCYTTTKNVSCSTCSYEDRIDRACQDTHGLPRDLYLQDFTQMYICIRLTKLWLK